MSKKSFKMKGRVWLYPGESASWHFVTLPKKEGEEIKKSFGANARGWGSLPVQVTIGPTSPRLRRASKTTWKTSIFPDKKSGSYLLPLKAAIRMKEGIREGKTITFTLEVKSK